MSRPRGWRSSCDPEGIFELVEGTLGPEREREVREHLQRCSGCRTSYEQELNLSASLYALERAEAPCRSVCPGVVMALPTRRLRARILWAALALALLAAAVLALSLNALPPAAVAVNAMNSVWGIVSGSEGVARVVLSAAGPTLLIALAVGAAVDVCIAAAVLLVKSRRVRQV